MADPTPPPAEGKVPGQMFDEHLVEVFRPAIAQAFTQHADVLRSVVVVFDYYGALNDAQGLSKGIWLGPFGQVTTPDGVIGSAKNLIETLSVVLNRAQQVTAHLEQRLLRLQQETLEKEKQHDEQQAEAPQAEAPAEGG